MTALPPWSASPLTTPLLDRACALFDELCDAHSLQLGLDLSLAERAARGIPEGVQHALVYGETPFRSLGVILSRVRALLGGGASAFSSRTFVDLGSGTGKPVLAAALLHRWRGVRGIELCEGLHAASLELQERWEGGLPFLPPGERSLRYAIPPEVRATPVRFELGDATQLDWSDAGVVFACSTCFDAALFARLAKCAERLAAGAIVVTCSDRFPESAFELLDERVLVMSWGACSVFIQRRRGGSAG